MIKKHTFSLLSFVRNDKLSTDGLVPVYLRITVDGVRALLSTKTFVDPDRWNAKKGCVKGTTEDTRLLNGTIENFEHRAREVYNRLLADGKVISAETIKEEILGMKHKSRTLLHTFDLHVAEMETRKEIDIAPGTVRNWQVTQGHLKEYLQNRYNRTDIPFKGLDLKFITDFDLYAKTTWKCGNNASLKHIQRISKIVNLAVSNEWIAVNPFDRFEGKQQKARRTFLTEEELAAIEKKTMPMERLEKVKDIFVFSCYTGLAYVDLEKLTPDNIVTGIDKKKWIYTYRTKTAIKSNIPLLPVPISLLEKYKHYTTIPGNNKLLPMITNIKTNAYLKEIADLCGIKKNLTFHMARHTFATTITLTNGVPLETVSAMLGHIKISTTQIYAKVIEKKVSEDMSALHKKLLKRNRS
jgi:integrase